MTVLVVCSNSNGLPGGSGVKNPYAKQKRQVQPLDQEDPLEEEMTTGSSILAWEIPWTEESGGLQSMRLSESDTTEWLNSKQQKSYYMDFFKGWL